MLPIWSPEHAQLFFETVVTLATALAAVCSSLLVWRRY